MLIPILFNVYVILITDWLTNAVLGTTCLIGRYYAGASQSIRIMWSIGALLIPIYAIGTNAKLDGVRQNNFYRYSCMLSEKHSMIDLSYIP